MLLLSVIATASIAQPPFLFFPGARSIRPSGMGYTVDAPYGRVTARQVGTSWNVSGVEFRRVGSGWVQRPGGIHWAKAANRWEARGPGIRWTLEETATGMRLIHGGARTEWRREAGGWVMHR
jgi:hypothetical protein